MEDDRAATDGLRLSFILPVLNEAGHIGDNLRGLRAAFPDAQYIVVDGGSDDDSVVEAMPLATQLLVGPRGRALQMDLGARAACGDWLLFLHADTRPDFDLRRLRNALDPHAPWGFCRVRLSGAGPGLRLVETGMNLRSRLTGIGTGDQLLWMRRDFYLARGGFASLPLMEDVELCTRLRRHCRPRILPLTVVTSSRRWERRGLWRTVLEMWSLRLGFFLGISPQRLWSVYYGQG